MSQTDRGCSIKNLVYIRSFNLFLPLPVHSQIPVSLNKTELMKRLAINNKHDRKLKTSVNTHPCYTLNINVNYLNINDKNKEQILLNVRIFCFKIAHD